MSHDLLMMSSMHQAQNEVCKRCFGHCTGRGCNTNLREAKGLAGPEGHEIQSNDELTQIWQK